MSIEKSIDKVVDQNVEQITKDFKSFIPDNIVELIVSYSNGKSFEKSRC